MSVSVHVVSKSLYKVTMSIHKLSLSAYKLNHVEIPARRQEGFSRPVGMEDLVWF